MRPRCARGLRRNRRLHSGACRRTSPPAPSWTRWARASPTSTRRVCLVRQVARGSHGGRGIAGTTRRSALLRRQRVHRRDRESGAPAAAAMQRLWRLSQTMPSAGTVRSPRSTCRRRSGASMCSPIRVRAAPARPPLQRRHGLCRQPRQHGGLRRPAQSARSHHGPRPALGRPVRRPRAVAHRSTAHVRVAAQPHSRLLHRQEEDFGNVHLL